MSVSGQRIKPIDAALKEPLKSKMALIFPPSLPSPNLYRIVARNESLFMDLVDNKLIGPTGLLDRQNIKPRLREIIILRTCVAGRNDYEFNLHITTISEAMGLTKEQISDIRSEHPNASLWEEQEIALMKLIDSLVSRIEVSDTLFDEVSRYYSDSEIVEFVMLTGLYTSVAMLVAAARPEFDQYRL